MWGQPVPTFYIFLKFMGRFKTTYPLLKEQELVGSFQTEEGFQILPLNLMVSDHRTLRMYICHRTACLL